MHAKAQKKTALQMGSQHLERSAKLPSHEGLIAASRVSSDLHMFKLCFTPGVPLQENVGYPLVNLEVPISDSLTGFPPSSAGRNAGFAACAKKA